MIGKRRKQNGWLVAELAVSLVILAMLMGGLALSLNAFSKLNHYHLVQQCCIAAAQSQLESLTATGGKINDDDVERLWPGVKISIEQEPGRGDWQGLSLVTVSACSKSMGKTVSTQLARYIPAKPEKQ